MVELQDAAGFGDKVLGVVEKFAPIGGVAAAWLSKPLNSGDPLEFAEDAISHFKFANPIITTKIALKEPENYPIVQGAMFAIGGMIGEELAGEFKSTTGAKLARTAKKFGSSTFVNSIVSAYVYEAQNNPHGAKGGVKARGSIARQATNAKIDNPQNLSGYGNAYGSRAYLPQ